MPRTTPRAASPATSPADAAELLARARADGVRFLRLQFTDILGVNKNVEVPASRFAEALAGEVLFDGSAIEGFARPEESDMLLRPDLSTYRVLPWGVTPSDEARLGHGRADGQRDGRGADDDARVARMICDVTTTDGAAFAGDPRAVLRRELAAAAERGFTVRANAEVEFFLFRPGPDGAATTATHDVGGYFDLAPVDHGEEARRAMVDLLERLGVPVVGAHHEGAHGQHEIDLGDADALAAADDVVTLRFVVKHVARRFGLVASFMPKPVFGQNGSGLHTHQALFARDALGADGGLGENAFADPRAEWGLSRTALHYVGGLLRHARGMCAVTNPLVNSYKRLVPGFEAPVHVAWSLRSRTPLVRVPERRGAATRLEVRTPDPAANPYLALAVMIAAGLDGVATKAEWREPVAQEVAEMSWRERRRLRIDDLPHDLGEACDELERDDVVRAALGPHVTQHYLAAKRAEWREYSTQVTEWELRRYLARY
ncbi:MAG TPA: glutamine synthetase family protein [Gemmatirosa sp.]